MSELSNDPSSTTAPSSSTSYPKYLAGYLAKRLHSLSGLGLTLYLAFHLFTNSQAALFFGNYGRGFIHDVNWIHTLPYLIIVECLLLGLPFIIHAVLGIRYLFTGQYNSFRSDGSSASLPYGRNKAYTWQRITSWILLVGVTAHVIHMRIIEYPEVTSSGSKTYYTVSVSDDPGIYTLKDRLDYKVAPGKTPGEVLITADNFGTSTLMMVRDTFKSPLMMALYTIFVLSACFHGFNGLWTFMISWGITLSVRSQAVCLKVCQFLMVLVTLFGLSAIFATYWINLRN